MTAPYVAGSETSQAAAESVDGAKLRGIVLACLRTWAAKGMTCDEVEASLGMRHQTASARIRELALSGAIVDSGTRRKTRSGRSAVVWLAVKRGEENAEP